MEEADAEPVMDGDPLTYGSAGDALGRGLSPPVTCRTLQHTFLASSI